MYCTENLDKLTLKWFGNFQLDKIVNAAALFNNLKELKIVLNNYDTVDRYFEKADFKVGYNIGNRRISVTRLSAAAVIDIEYRFF